MYRSDEILKIFKNINIPIDITKHILDIEKKENLKQSIIEWRHIKIVALSYQNKPFFAEINRSFMLHDIQFINGDSKRLKKYRNTYISNNIKNELDGAFILSFRF
jgi:hypothetical protein